MRTWVWCGGAVALAGCLALAYWNTRLKPTESSVSLAASETVEWPAPAPFQPIPAPVTPLEPIAVHLEPIEAAPVETTPETEPEEVESETNTSLPPAPRVDQILVRMPYADEDDSEFVQLLRRAGEWRTELPMQSFPTATAPATTTEESEEPPLREMTPVPAQPQPMHCPYFERCPSPRR